MRRGRIKEKVKSERRCVQGMRMGMYVFVDKDERSASTSSAAKQDVI